MGKFIMSCTTCAYRAPGRDEVLETLKHAPEAGYKYWGLAGIWHSAFGVHRWLDVDKINALSKSANLKGITEVYAGPIRTESMEAALSYVNDSLLSSAEFSVALGCPLLVFSGGRRLEDTPGLDAHVAGLNRLLEGIKNMNLKVAIEPHYRSWFSSAEDFDYIFDRIDHPQLGITVDTGHFHSAGVDTPGFIKKYAPKILNVHLKDHVGTQSVNIGDGEIDLKGIFSLLKDLDFSGPLALEIEPKDKENLPKYVKLSYDYITGLLDEIGAEYE